jgi:hypothetical protein
MGNPLRVGAAGAVAGRLGVTCVFPDSRPIIAHIIVELAEGRITRQVHVESWG